jgi:glycosyltransferase involved in cell wall biosynthesis
MPTKISVVIPTFKRPKLLTRCLRALTRQTLDKNDFEVIVVTDGPDSATMLALEPWLNKKELNLQVWQTPEKNGPASARNYGWLNAKSDLIAFTDDDCIPDRHWLKALSRRHASEEHIAFSGRTKVPLPKHPTDYALNTAGLETAEFITANCACTKKALIKTGGFDQRFKAAWREDSDLHFKFLEHDVAVIDVPEALVLHPVREAPWGVSILEQKKSKYDALLYQKFPKLYKLKIQNGQLWHYYLINLGWLTLLLSAYGHARYFFLFSLAYIADIVFEFYH